MPNPVRRYQENGTDGRDTKAGALIIKKEKELFIFFKGREESTLAGRKIEAKWNAACQGKWDWRGEK